MFCLTQGFKARRRTWDMDDVDRDSTQDWLLPEAAKPPLLSELVRRVDYAVATARASEAAVVAVGEAALDAAKQARRAAELAERASAAMLGGGRLASRAGSGRAAFDAVSRTAGCAASLSGQTASPGAYISWSGSLCRVPLLHALISVEPAYARYPAGAQLPIDPGAFRSPDDHRPLLGMPAMTQPISASSRSSCSTGFSTRHTSLHLTKPVITIEMERKDRGGRVTGSRFAGRKALTRHRVIRAQADLATLAERPDRRR